MTAETHGPVHSAPGEGVHDSRMSALVESLSRARRRSNFRALINGLITSILIGLALFIVLELSDRVLGGLSPILSFEWIATPAWLSEWRPSPIPQHLIVAVAGALAAFVVALITAAFSQPGINRMARAADREFASQERFSTALQLARSSGAKGVVGEALLQDAARRAAEVDARKLTPITLGWQTLLVPVLAIVAVLIINSPPDETAANASVGEAAPVVGNGGTPAFTDEDRLDTAGEIRAIAAILAQDGQNRSDPVLQAVANELNALGNEVAANPNVDRTAVGDELARLADAAQNAYAAAGLGETDNANYAQLVDEALRAVDPGRYVVEEENAGEEAVFQEGVFDAGNVAGANVPTEDTLTLPEGPDVVAEAVEVVEGANVPAEMQHEWDNPYEEPGMPDDYAVNPEVEVIGLGDGAGGNLAGIGAAELGGVAGAPIVPGLTEGELLLVDPDPGNGRMLQLNLPPLAELMAVDTDGLETGLWRQFQEGEVERTAVPAADLEAVGRYFQAMMAEREE